MPARLSLVVSLVLLLLPSASRAADTGGVYNGSFRKTVAGGERPDGWQAAGDKAIVQEVAVERDPQRGQVARLCCTRFVPGTPSSHVMIAQFGHVGVQAGHWYRVSLWARAKDLETGVVQLRLTDVRRWTPVGLSKSFLPGERWQHYEFVFHADRDLKPADSRLSAYFQSSGTLWLADMTFAETTAMKEQWLPAIPMTGVTNALPNSSFEAGEGWGTSACGNFGWTANLFQRLGRWDDSQAYHGKRSWKVTLSAHKPPMLYGGYLHSVTEVRTVELAHAGWVHVAPGQSYTFSVYLKSDRPDASVVACLKEPESRRSNHRKYSIGRQWQRIQVSYVPRGESLRGCVTFSLPKGDRGSATLWLDAAQFERGKTASPYRPRTDLEAGIETGVVGNLFTDPAKGLTCRLRAINASKEPRKLDGRLRVTDFWDRTVWQERPEIEVAPGGAVERTYTVLAGKRGFFRIHWEPAGGLAQSLRCAVIDPCRENDSPFGFNHAFGLDFLLPLAHQAGLRWWRDWSTQWDTLQPERGAAFDFHMPDVQINRVLERQGRMLVLLPYPGAGWSASHYPKAVEELRQSVQEGKGGSYELRQAIIAAKPDRLEDFAAYVRATVGHDQGRVAHYEILNEPLYTHYALPNTAQGYAYDVSDYIDVLRTAYQAAKAVDPACTVVGGIACPPEAGWAGRFIEQGGLQWCDVMNYHLYPTLRRPETLEPILHEHCRQMQDRGQVRPIWVTEFGLYAEDDPVTLPAHAGDLTMDDAMRPSERIAAADLVQWAAVMFAHGVRKVFYHAGVCQGYHQASAGNIFFEYGGLPRKMLPAVAVLARWLGPDFQFVRKWDKPAWLLAYEFRSRGRPVVILWTHKTDAPQLDLPRGLRAFDLMGNAIDGRRITVGEEPMYLVGE